MIIAKSFCFSLVLMGVIASNGACFHRNAGERDGLAPDSVTGFVTVTGTAFEHQLMLRTGDKTITLAANPSDSMALTNLAGVEIRARGYMNGLAIRVTSFTAMRVDGAPVVDGILISKAGQLFLKTMTGVRLLGNPPAQLREMISARVWVGGPLDTGPNNYGVIAPAMQTGIVR